MEIPDYDGGERTMPHKVAQRLPDVRTLYQILPKGKEGVAEFGGIVDLLLYHQARRMRNTITLFSDVAGADAITLDNFLASFRQESVSKSVCSVLPFAIEAVVQPSFTSVRPTNRHIAHLAANEANSLTRRGFLGFMGALVPLMGHSKAAGEELSAKKPSAQRHSNSPSLRLTMPEFAVELDAGHPPPHHDADADYPMMNDDYDAGHFGGLGTGSMGRNLFGQMTSVNFSGRRSNQIFPEGQICVREKGGDRTWATPLGMHPDPTHTKDTRLIAWNWTDAEKMAKSAKVRLLHPYSQWEYGRPLEGQRGQVTVRQFSPLIPEDLDASALPVWITEVEVENTGPEAREFSVMVSMPNFAGWGSEMGDPGYYKFLPSGRTQRVGPVRVGKFAGLAMGALKADDPRFLGSSVLLTEERPGLEFYSFAGFDVNDASQKQLWDSFVKDGTLPSIHQNVRGDSPGEAGKETASAVAVKFVLPPGERRRIPFAYSFNFPLDIRNAKSFKKKYTARSSTVSPEDEAIRISRLALEQRTNWSALIDQWQRRILNDARIPAPVKSELVNELYFMVAGGGLFPMDGPFVPLEASDCRILGTSDVHFDTSMDANLFPGLERKYLLEMARAVLWEDHTIVMAHGPYVTGNKEWTSKVFGGDEEANLKALAEPLGGFKIPGAYPMFQKVRGSVPASLDDWLLGGVVDQVDGKTVDDPETLRVARYLRNNNTWKDLSPKFVLMLWRAYVLDGRKDKRFLQGTWEALQATLEFHKKYFVDATGLPVHKGFPDWTYDTWTVNGYTIYTAVLTMMALEAAIAIGKEIGKSDAELQSYSDWLKKGRENIQKLLWNDKGRYFYISAEKGPDGTIVPNDDIMSDALKGELYGKLYGLPPVVRPEQVTGHLRAVYDNNFRKFHGGTVGVVNGIKGNGEAVSSGAGDFEAAEVWIGVQRAVAAHMLAVGMKTEAQNILNVDFKNTWLGGFQGRTPEALAVAETEKDGPLRFRSAVYMRAGAIWMVYEALVLFSGRRELLARLQEWSEPSSATHV